MEKVPFDQPDATGIESAFVSWIIPTGSAIPPWWSRGRDLWLRNFYRSVDGLKIAVYTFSAKVLNVPMHIQARDNSIRSHVEEAEQIEESLLTNSGVTTGWHEEMSKFITDFLTTDSGGHLYVMGSPNRADKPLIGAATGIYHLDSVRVTRTGNKEFPIIFRDRDGTAYKFHHTRCVSLSDLPSPELEMNGVGLCAVTRALDSANEQGDISNYTREKMGSKPQRGILYVKTGGTIGELEDAVKKAEMKDAAQGNSFYSRTALLAPRNPNSVLELDLVELSKLPDGFNRRDSAILNMSHIAAAFGLDLRDLSFPLGLAGGKQDAEVQDRKGRGKGVGDCIKTIAEAINQFVLPPHLKVVFDYLDDDQDMRESDIRSKRAESRYKDLSSGVTTVRVERERMASAGEITSQQFEDMELADGRQADGTDVLQLFYTDDKYVQTMLSMPELAEPTDIAANDPFVAIQAIEAAKRRIYEISSKYASTRVMRSSRRATAALNRLRSLYEEAATQTIRPVESYTEEPTADAISSQPDDPTTNIDGTPETEMANPSPTPTGDGV